MYYLCRTIKQLKYKKMTIFKNEMTIEDASNLLKSKTGMSYPDTPHNRKIMKEAIDNSLKLIRAKNGK